jgi:ribosomal protein S12 methylthiotransferase
MGRCGSRRQLDSLIASARRYLPDVILRTSIIVGFPGETEDDFEELLDFVRKIRFQRLGSFEFSCQEGTPAANLPDQVPPNLRKERRDRLMEVQMEISAQCNLERVGSVEEVFVDEYEKASGYSLAHSRKDLPELDGDILLPGKYQVGARLKVHISSALEYDLMAEVVESS